MAVLQSIIDAANTVIWSYILLILASGLGIYFAIKTKFVQFRHLGEMIRLTFGGGRKKKEKEKADKEKDPDAISPFQALCIACGGCIGTGNVAGVALAIVAGGPGAVFWMWLIALLGAGTSFIENTLAQLFKCRDEGGGFRGGPAYYMEKGLGKRWMGIIFAVCMILSFGFALAALQANTIAQAWDAAFSVSPVIMGIIICALAALIVIGGVQRIGKFSEAIVPFMAIAYLLLSLAILIIHYDKIPALFTSIFKGAFGLDAVFGGTLGAALIQGVKRGIFSNGAGQGDSPQASAAARTTHPAKQGLIQAFAIYIDTILVCSATAMMVVISGSYASAEVDAEGVQLVQHSASMMIGGWASKFIAVVMFLFCFTSLISNYYYGESNLAFIMRSSKFRKAYRVCFLLMLFWGAVSGLDIVWDLADLFGGTLAVVNMIALIFLGKISVSVMKEYEAQQKAGIEEPIFRTSSIPDLDLSEAECWIDPVKK